MIGTTTLFTIADGEQRPFLIIKHDPHTDIATGLLFLDISEDRSHKWVYDNLFWANDNSGSVFPVKSATRGPLVGQWQPKDNK
jgi:hypothetical protein